MTAPIERDHDDYRTLNTGRRTLFSASHAVVDGIRSSRLDSVACARLMFDLYPDGARSQVFHWRADFEVDEGRYLKTSYIHRVDCRCVFDDDPCRERRYG